jgi:hypothetical protein
MVDSLNRILRWFPSDFQISCHVTLLPCVHSHLTHARCCCIPSALACLFSASAFLTFSVPVVFFSPSCWLSFIVLKVLCLDLVYQCTLPLAPTRYLCFRLLLQLFHLPFTFRLLILLLLSCHLLNLTAS